MAPRRPCILIVDDVDDNVFILERRLKQFLDPDIASVGNGRAALERLERQPFDLVLLDVQMPELDGLAVLEQMKSDLSLRDIPVIMVSAVDDFDTVLRCIKLGAEDYVQKPFNADLLREEKARVNALLHSILPKAIVTDLKAHGRPKAKRYEDVAVLFCDIVNF